MDRIEFTLDGTRYELNQDKVRAALRNQIPGRIQVHAVDVDGTLFPVKQALAQALQIPKSRFISTRAVELLRKVGMKVVDTDMQEPVELMHQWTLSRSDGADPDVRHAALYLAILHLSTADRPVDGTEVIKFADQFASWLSHGE